MCPIAQPSWRLGVIFLLILDNAPSHACRLVCDHHRTVLHGTVEFQPLRTPNLSLRLFWNELKTQLVQHPVPADLGELRALLTHVYHRTRTGSRWMLEKMGKAWVRRLKALRCRHRRFFQVARTWQTASYRSKTQRKNTSLTRHLPLQNTLHSRRQQHRHR